LYPKRTDGLFKMIIIRQKGDFKHTEGFFKRVKEKKYYAALNEAGRKGVAALKQTTPKDTGLTANSWSYTIELNDTGARIIFENSNVKKGYANVAILLEYGHATRNGGWVEGTDYINPALKPVFEEIADKVWAEVTKS